MIIEVKDDDYLLISKLEYTFNYVIKDIIEDFKNNPYSHYLVYKHKDKIYGFINYYLIYDRIEIANFNVLDTFQNMGIGTKLLEYLINEYKNIKNITLEVRCDNIKAIISQKRSVLLISNSIGKGREFYDILKEEYKENNIKAITLYEKMGFKVVGTREAYYDGIDGLLMERS